MKKIFTEKNGVVLMAMTPMVLLIATFSVFPICFAFYISFHNWSFVSEPEFAGLSNYVKALGSFDSLFYKSLWNTFKFVLLTVPVINIFAILIAKLITKSGKYEPIFRTVFFLPVVTNVVAVSLLWKYFYLPGSSGLFNAILGLFGIKNQVWMSDQSLAMPCIALMYIWSSMGYSVILYIAGINNVPSQLYEAAKIDGAGPVQRFFSITLPLLTPTIRFCVITGTIGSLQMFVQVMMLTRGGPLNSTRTVVFHLYRAAFDDFNIGFACAVSFILFFIIICITIVNFRLTKSKWEY